VQHELLITLSIAQVCSAWLVIFPRRSPPCRAGYVLTEDLVREIAAGAALKPHNHSLFKLEDIAMGSWIEHIQQERNIRVRVLL